MAYYPIRTRRRNPYAFNGCCGFAGTQVPESEWIGYQFTTVAYASQQEVQDLLIEAGRELQAEGDGKILESAILQTPEGLFYAIIKFLAPPRELPEGGQQKSNGVLMYLPSVSTEEQAASVGDEIVTQTTGKLPGWVLPVGLSVGIAGLLVVGAVVYKVVKK